MPARLSPEQAAERLQPSDTLGIPLGTGQPAGLIEALGERDDWEELLEAAERASGGRAPRTS